MSLKMIDRNYAGAIIRLINLPPVTIPGTNPKTVRFVMAQVPARRPMAK